MVGYIIVVGAAFVYSLGVVGGSRLPASSKAESGQAERGLRGEHHRRVVHCSTLQCPDRSTPITAASRTKCRGNTCVASQCCEAKCSYHQCPASTTPMKDADGIVCPNLECTDDLCCEDTTYTPSASLLATGFSSGSASTTVWASGSASATSVHGGGRQLQDAVYCSSFQCPHRSTPIKDACTTKCESDTCEASQCCEARCSYHQCPDRSAPIEDADTSVCADLACTDDLCCQALCSYHQCPSGEGLVVGGDDLVCPELECSNELCCGIQIIPHEYVTNHNYSEPEAEAGSDVGDSSD